MTHQVDATAQICEGKAVAVTGAGRGIGRAYAIGLAAAGASVVVNDLSGADDPAAEVVDQIRRAGGTAVANHDDVSTEEGAHRFVDQAISEFGKIDVLINNAGILRDAMIFNMTADAWDAVIGVHLRGTFLTTQYVASIWRDQFKSGEKVDGRVINTTSVAGLYGNTGQANYVAAKAGIVGFTIGVSRELDRYGIAVNVISPGALTRMTENLVDDEAIAATLAPENVAKAAVWLASPAALGITGRVIHASGRELAIPSGWSPGRVANSPAELTPTEVGAVLTSLLAEARPNALLDGTIPELV